MPTLVCLPIMVLDAHQALADAQSAKSAGADLVEFRLDECFSGDIDGEAGLIERVISQSPLPCIATCRLASEGGHYEGEEMARISLFERLCVASHGPRYLDVEWDAYSRSTNLRQKVRLCVQHGAQLREVRTSLVLSAHDFAGRPADLVRRLAAMCDDPARGVVKIAYRSRSLHDALEVLELPAQLGVPTIALGMGDFGVMSRVLAPKFGGFLTFASLRQAASTAPGQLTIRELLDSYRFRTIGPRTRVYGIIGWPVVQSLSPLVHNAAFAMHAVDAVYVPLPIASHDADPQASDAAFNAMMLELIEHPRLDLAGVSVTMPHKERLVSLARTRGWALDEASQAIGAANTLVLRDGRTGHMLPAPRVLNTDAPAVAVCISRLLRAARGPALRDANIGVLGAGGAARAAAWACLREGANVVLYNRDAERAKRAAHEVATAIPASARGTCVGMPLDALPKSCCDGFVQATPVGMGDAGDATLLPVANMRQCSPRTVLLETIYRPPVTRAMREAREAGWSVAGGAGMFVEQALLQSQAFIGQPGHRELFARLVDEALSIAPGALGSARIEGGEGEGA